jgi:hypothetical protein
MFAPSVAISAAEAGDQIDYSLERYCFHTHQPFPEWFSVNNRSWSKKKLEIKQHTFLPALHSLGSFSTKTCSISVTSRVEGSRRGALVGECESTVIAGADISQCM